MRRAGRNGGGGGPTPGDVELDDMEKQPASLQEQNFFMEVQQNDKKIVSGQPQAILRWLIPGFLLGRDAGCVVRWPQEPERDGTRHESSNFAIAQ